MPRDGSNIYHRPPGTDAVPDTTIESTKYNSNVADVEQDLNVPRPIVAGGTGAANAHDAMIALSGEIANQVVTNYDTHPFVAGSLWSAPGATAGPPSGGTTTDYFSGIYYEAGTGSRFVEVRHAVTGIQYMRQYIFGTGWSAWKQQPGSAADLDAAYVNVTGDTMSGNLSINMNSPTLLLQKNGPGQNATIFGTLGATSRWAISLGNTATESGSNAGSNFEIYRYADGGALNDVALSINRANGQAVFWREITAGFVGVTGTYYFGNSGTKSLNYDGTNFTLTGGSLITSNNINMAGNILSVGTATADAVVRFGSSGASHYLYYDGTQFTFVGGIVNAVAGNFSASAAWQNGPALCANMDTASVWPVAIRGNDRGILYLAAGSASNIYAYFTQGTTSNAVGTITGTASATSYNTSSSGELKEDLKSFDAGNIIDATNVYDFKWKSTDERAYGVIAQQAIDVYPLAVTHMQVETAEGDNDFWGVDYSKYVPVLLQEIKALRARVAALEGK
jgi:hypothetical protein